MTLVVKPSLPLTGGPIVASDVHSHSDAILAALNGGVDSANLSANPNFPGTCISTSSPIPTNRIADDAVDKDKLKDDATAGSPNAAVNTANHIKDGIITPAKLAVPGAGSGIGLDRLRVLKYASQIPASSLAPGATYSEIIATIGSVGSGNWLVLSCGLELSGITPPGTAPVPALSAIAGLKVSWMEYPSGSGHSFMSLMVTNTGLSSFAFPVSGSTYFNLVAYFMRRTTG